MCEIKLLGRGMKLVSQARRLPRAGGTAVRGKRGKEHPVTINIDRFSWTLPECWRYQWDWRSFNNYIYLPYWSHDKALLILLTRLRSVRKKFYGVLWALAKAGASDKTLCVKGMTWMMACVSLQPGAESRCAKSYSYEAFISCYLH